MSTPSPARRRGFTLVEILVVIAVIAILLGLLLTGLRSAIYASRRTGQLNALRQVYYGWTMYSNQNGEQLLPGYVDVDTQDQWKLKYRDKQGNQLAPELSASWGWRIAGFVDFSWDVLLGYRDDAIEDLSDIPPVVLAEEPAFGYNALYLGGWWTVQGDDEPPRARYSRQIARTAGSIERTEQQIVFAASGNRGTGLLKANDNDRFPGAHWCSPPFQAQTQIWDEGFGNGQLQVFASGQPVPLNRFGNTVAVVLGDGGTVPLTVGELRDMRRWVNAATGKDWTHPPDP